MRRVLCFSKNGRADFVGLKPHAPSVGWGGGRETGNEKDKFADDANAA